jgi:hypothetical protein
MMDLLLQHEEFLVRFQLDGGEHRIIGPADGVDADAGGSSCR